MSEIHERIYHGFIIAVELVPEANGMVKACASSRSLSSGQTGPSEIRTLPADPNLLLDVFSRIEDAIDDQAARR